MVDGSFSSTLDNLLTANVSAINFLVDETSVQALLRSWIDQLPNSKITLRKRAVADGVESAGDDGAVYAYNGAARHLCRRCVQKCSLFTDLRDVCLTCRLPLPTRVGRKPETPLPARTRDPPARPRSEFRDIFSNFIRILSVSLFKSVGSRTSYL